ncbi:MAG TPA: cupin domain-containing protein [Candidatus Dormibacteraeota bacterium]|nr:cupin domain-containing protein [Candidatus Dormibacteraeota bacterium]
MARTGQVLEEDGEQIEFLATAADTEGALVRCRLRVATSRPAPPPHIHPRQEERFKIEAGRFGYILGSNRLEAGPGDVVVVPPGVRHAFWNAGDEPLTVVTDVRPALRFEDFVETIHVLIRNGMVAAGGRRPNLLLLAVVARQFRNEWRLTDLSPAARALLPLLAFLGRRAGFKGHYRADGESASREIAAVL